MDLKIKSVIGFNGKAVNCLHYTPCGKYIVYPLGSFVVLKNLRTDKEAFLDGHTHPVFSISVSHSGERLVTGQTHLTGVKADMIIWDLTEAKRLLDAGNVMIGERVLMHRLKQHLGLVQDVDFSANDQFICSLGGQDDNAVVIWDTDSGTAICGSPAAADSALCCKWVNNRNDRVVTAGNYHLRVWQVDFSLPKLHAMDAKMGNVRRVIISLAITDDDHIAYCGTTTGDIIKCKIDRNEIMSFKDPDVTVPQMLGVSVYKFPVGARTVACLRNPQTGNINILVGGGDGDVALLNANLGLVAGYKTKLKGGISSITVHPKGDKYMIGTDQCNRYEVSKDLINSDLKTSCHFGAINDVAFPDMCSDLIITSSKGDVRVWNTNQKKELLRIQVPNLECLSSVVSPTGSAIVSGWDDGKIRAFYPESGRMKFVIPDAHSEFVTAVACADSDHKSPWRIVSGGAEGRVRVWNVTPSHQSMVISLKEHRGPVNCIKINADSTQAISASSDGCCIVWDLNRYVRLTALFEQTIFESVCYHPDESQMLTCGSNHKITYWDAVDGEQIRVIEGGEDNMTALDILPSGEYFVSGSRDKLLKIWHYDDGLPVCIGKGHSGAIKAVKVSPDLRSVVSVGTNGEIIFWEVPNLAEAREQYA